MDFIAIIAGKNSQPSTFAVKIINVQGETKDEIAGRMHQLAPKTLKALHLQTVEFVAVASPKEYYTFLFPRLAYTVTSEAEFIAMTETPKRFQEHERVLA